MFNVRAALKQLRKQFISTNAPTILACNEKHLLKVFHQNKSGLRFENDARKTAINGNTLLEGVCIRLT